MSRYYTPTSVEDACQLLAANAAESAVIAGGQTLTLLLRQGLRNPDRLVDISDLDELGGVSEKDDAVSIGSANTYAELRRSEVLQSSFPYFTEALEEIAGPQVQHNGTLGGALCYGDPALDSPPVLLTLDAELRLRSVDGERTVPLSEFYTGYYETDLEPGEILVAADVPKLPVDSHGTYRTMTPRKGDYALAGVAVRLSFDGEECTVARIGLTNAGDTTMRAYDAEDELEGTTLDHEAIDAAVTAVHNSLDVLGDEQTSKSYKETVFQRLSKQAIRDTREAHEEGSQ